MKMQHTVKTLKIIVGQSNTLLVVIKEEESVMCTHDEQTQIPYSNVNRFSWSTYAPVMSIHLHMFIFIHERKIY